MPIQNRTNKLKIKISDKNTGRPVDLNTVAEAVYTVFAPTTITKTLGNGIAKEGSFLIVTINKNECNFFGNFDHELKVTNQIGETYGIDMGSAKINFTKTRT